MALGQAQLTAGQRNDTQTWINRGAHLGRIQGRDRNCHVGNSPPAQLNLSAALAHAQLVNIAAQELNCMKRVTPNNTAQATSSTRSKAIRVRWAAQAARCRRAGRS
jgi:hypothetical protein